MTKTLLATALFLSFSSIGSATDLYFTTAEVQDRVVQPAGTKNETVAQLDSPEGPALGPVPAPTEESSPPLKGVTKTLPSKKGFEKKASSWRHHKHLVAANKKKKKSKHGKSFASNHKRGHSTKGRKVASSKNPVKIDAYLCAAACAEQLIIFLILTLK